MHEPIMKEASAHNAGRSVREMGRPEGRGVRGYLQSNLALTRRDST